MSKNQNITVEQAWEVLRANFVQTLETNEPNFTKVHEVMGFDRTEEGPEAAEAREKILNHPTNTFTETMAHIAKNTDSFELFVWLCFQYFMQSGEHRGIKKAKQELIQEALKAMLK